ncbi:hypothetical protein F7725_019276, partial [Dissostichus mawsoni]
MRTEPARLVLPLGGSSSMARWVEEAWVEVPWVEVPRDFLTMGVLGSRSSSWAKSGSFSTCRLSFTIRLRRVEGGEEGAEQEEQEEEEGGKPAHSKHVFLLPTQNTEGIPTISIITYFVRKRARGISMRTRFRAAMPASSSATPTCHNERGG